MTNSNLPLCTDLDGTLVRGDTLWEQCIQVIKSNPLYSFALPLWALQGKIAFKSKIASLAGPLQAGTLPYQADFLKYLEAEKSKGRTLVLCTASHEKSAQAVADSLQIFSEVLASNEKQNLSGANKAAALTERFGAGNFDYAGNHYVDIPIWEKANRAILVNAPGSLIAKAKSSYKDPLIFDDRKNFLLTFVKTARIKQWVKNILLFVPLVMGHEITNPHLLIRTFALFISFGLVASATYLVNDLLDMQSDRLHKLKRKRPFAAGDMPVPLGLAIVPPMLISGFLLAYALSPESFLILGAYFIMTSLYSLWFKRLLLVDVIMLALLYTIRIWAGGFVTGVEISAWLLMFSLFFFTSLALVKRYSELKALPQEKGNALHGRGYLRPDLDQLAALGTACGLISVLVVALYINSPKVVEMYSQPQIIWFICPLLLYWIGRVWLIARRGFMPDDPIIFALTDPESYLTAFLMGLCLFLGSIL